MTRMRVLFISSIWLLCTSACLAFGTLGGTMQNEWGDGLVGGLAIIADCERFGVVSHPNGSYEVSRIPAGRHDVLYVTTAYDSLLVRNVVIADDSLTFLPVILLLSDRERGARLDTVDLMPAPPDSLTEMESDSTGTEEK